MLHYCYSIVSFTLPALPSQLTLPIIIAYAIETTKYRLDDEVMHGKNGQSALDPVRVQAMLSLAFLASNAPSPHVTVPLIEKALYGEVQVEVYVRSDRVVLGLDWQA